MGRCSIKGARAKGARAETEVVEILTENGIPSQRVLASGAYRTAKADIKVGVPLVDGELPPGDEGTCLMRVEVKNHQTNPESLYQGIPESGVIFAPSLKPGPEALWKFLAQDDVSTALVMRRKVAPNGAVKNKDWNQVYMVCMGLNDYIELFKKAYSKELGS